MKKEIKEQIVLNEIVEDLKQFKHSNLHQCPYCDEVFEWNDADYNPEENTYKCEQPKTEKLNKQHNPSCR